MARHGLARLPVIVPSPFAGEGSYEMSASCTGELMHLARPSPISFCCIGRAALSRKWRGRHNSLRLRRQTWHAPAYSDRSGPPAVAHICRDQPLWKPQHQSGGGLQWNLSGSHDRDGAENTITAGENDAT